MPNYRQSLLKLLAWRMTRGFRLFTLSALRTFDHEDHSRP
jgi:hypothetical protein